MATDVNGETTMGEAVAKLAEVGGVYRECRSAALGTR